MEKNGAINHGQLLRLRKILAMLREKERVTHAEMATANECSKKSIQRDIEVLKANGWPIEYDKRGHYISPKRLGELTTSGNKQIAALVLAGCSVDKHLMEYFPSAAMIIRESVLDLPDVQSLKFKLDDSSIYLERCSMNVDQLEVYGAVARSIIEGLAIEFLYRAVSKPNSIKRCVYPISLKQKESVWYLVGYDLERHALRVFTLSKVQHVHTYAEPYGEPPSEVVEQALAFGEFSIWDTGSDDRKIYSVKVRLFSHAADFVRSHHIHHSQKVEVVDEDTVVLKLETSDLTGVNLWLRKFMHLVQVIEPKLLKDQFIDDLRESLRMNEAVE